MTRSAQMCPLPRCKLARKRNGQRRCRIRVEAAGQERGQECIFVFRSISICHYYYIIMLLRSRSCLCIYIERLVLLYYSYYSYSHCTTYIYPYPPIWAIILFILVVTSGSWESRGANSDVFWLQHAFYCFVCISGAEKESQKDSPQSQILVLFNVFNAFRPLLHASLFLKKHAAEIAEPSAV
jgi:hypothetical protein